MGATQSKRRRKEKRRKKKNYKGLGYDLGVPRSSSAGVLGIPRPSCQLCQEFVTRRTLAASLELSQQHHLHHQCLQEQYEKLVDSGDGYDSCPSCSSSSFCLSNPRLDVDKSTMSLNRNLTTKSSIMTQSKSSEFTELLDMLRSQEIWKEKLLTASSKTVKPPVVEGFQCDMLAVSVTARPTKPTQTSLPSPVRETPKTVAEKTKHSKKDMNCLSLLEDNECRQTRRAKQKLMAQQLSILRRHIQKQEVMSSESPLPFPFLDENQGEESFNMTHTLDKCVPASESEFYECTTSEENAHHSSRPNTPGKAARSKFSKLSNYRYLDNHPVLSKLQNEQNNRLESMEKRMKEIRTSAMQEAERRKYAEFFPAKEDKSQTEKMFQEARETLEKIKEEKRKKKDDKSFRQIRMKTKSTTPSKSEDSGEVIPIQIQVVPVWTGEKLETAESNPGGSKSCESGGKLCHKVSKSGDGRKKSVWLNEAWPYINLSHPLTWLLLPFLMFPLILRLLLSLIFSTASSRDGSANSSPGRNSLDSIRKRL